MLTDGSSEGLQFVVASGYRDVETQQQLLDEDIEADMQNEGMSWQEAYDKETRISGFCTGRPDASVI